MAVGQQQATEAARRRVAHQVDGRQVERRDEGGEILDEGVQRDLLVRVELAVGPGAAAAQGDAAEVGGEGRHLEVPVPVVADAAVDEDHRLAPAEFDVGEVGPVDRCRRGHRALLVVPQLATAHSATQGSS